MLKTETNTQAVKLQVLRAAKKALRERTLNGVFEHGQWWVVNWRTGAQWSVNDAEGPGSTDGFSFEQVTQAMEGRDG